ncbi:MAG: hypothetical protein ACXAC2_10320, partial [Candidatus Kariarchaeaceae archaeon]
MGSQNKIFNIKRVFLVQLILLFVLSQVSVSQASTVLYNENAVDLNSNIDSISNIGIQTGSISDAQT